jgi:hypothetical protein
MTFNNEQKAMIVRKAADILRKGWTQGTMARDGDSLPVGVTDSTAKCWCAVGAISRAAWDTYRSSLSYFDAKTDLLYEMDRFCDITGKGRSVINFNDSHAQSVDEVIEMFNRYVESLVAESLSDV